jgi:hypothetical protein
MFPQSASTHVTASDQIGKNQCLILEDGAVVIETPNGVRRFKDLQELIERFDKALEVLADACDSAASNLFGGPTQSARVSQRSVEAVPPPRPKRLTAKSLP